MMKTILTSDGVILEERQIARLKKEIEYLIDELQYREKKLKKLRNTSDFLKGYDALWQEGPKTFYKNPDNWRKAENTL
ncbi:MAG: hypothetical protein ABSA75_12910 [Candidatus Bathyarchaeia archaeon]|jgi:hypothetical protein